MANVNHKNSPGPADTGKSIHLSASAGSGKTRALKERYLALLDVLNKRGLHIDQAVAITFTDKAAAEIKERVMNDLPESMLKKIIRGRQDLRISTIHSFCMNLLKRYPLEAGLPPDFGVLDTRDQAYKIIKAIEDALEEADRDAELMAPLDEFTADELITRLEFLFTIRSKLKRLEIDAGGPDGLLASVHNGMKIRSIESELAQLLSGSTWRDSLSRMEQLLRAEAGQYENSKGRDHLLLSAASDVDSAVRLARVLAPVYLTVSGTPRKNPFLPKKTFRGNRAEYETLYAQVQEMLNNFRSLSARLVSGREAVSLIKLFQQAEHHYRFSKLREGLLDFDDLEILAYELLRGIESPDILYWLDRKILHFLVDEFQDTSDIQWAILHRLTEEIFAGEGTEKPMQPTIFVVGDAKQSIYRFREANYRLIEKVKQDMERNLSPETRDVLSLDKNFRSTPAVIEAVNTVFNTLWGSAYEPSQPERAAHQGSVRVIEILEQTGESRLQSEARILAGEIKSLVEQGTPVYERPDAPGGKWHVREATYDDCAVLIQSRTRLKEYETALQELNIPYRVVGGIGFYEEDEIQALMNVLFFLWNHDDTLALAALLKSRLFGLSDRDIYDLMQHQEGMTEALKSKHPTCAELVHQWMKLAGLVPLATLLHRVIQDTAAYVRFGSRFPQAIFNIDKLLDTAREFDRRGYTTLQDFVEWVRNIRQTEQREATADMNLPGFQGSVSVMTVHKAKGLEYPIVFLPGINQQPRSLSAGPLALVESGQHLRMAIKDSGSEVYRELWEQEKEELRGEHQRLLYVAMTRARDHLVMIGTLNGPSRPVQQNTWLAWLRETAGGLLFSNKYDRDPGISVFVYPAEAVRPVAAREQKTVATGVTDRINRTTVLQNISPLPRSESLEWKKATDFIRHDQERQGDEQVSFASGSTVSPLTRGSVLHRCLELFTKTGSYDIHRISADYPEIRLLPPEKRTSFIADAESVLNRVTGDPRLSWIFESGPHSYSELPFLYRKEDALVSGVIDRVVIKDGKASVIDYKAILAEQDGEIAAWLDHYRPQVMIYCEAVKEMFACPAVEGFLLFLDSNKLAFCF